MNPVEYNQWKFWNSPMTLLHGVNRLLPFLLSVAFVAGCASRQQSVKVPSVIIPSVPQARQTARPERAVSAPQEVLAPVIESDPLVWDASPSPDVTEYRVMLGLVRGGETNIAATVSGTSASISRPSGTNYWYNVVAVGPGGTSLPSNTIRLPGNTLLAFDLETWFGTNVVSRNLVTYTNLPPGDRMMIVPKQWKDYSP
jgi:hypothetical protein